MSENDRYSFSEAFHTALRKGCDTNHSVGFWNALHLIIPCGAWNSLCDYAEAGWKKNPDALAFDLAAGWVASGAGDHKGTPQGNLLCWFIQSADKETRNEVNETIAYWQSLQV